MIGKASAVPQTARPSQTTHEHTPLAKLVGWQEWVSLPQLGVDRIKVKVDTGARTSALHAQSITAELIDGEEWVNFVLHPLQDNVQVEISCRARVVGHRVVRDSGGHEQTRVVIETDMSLGEDKWPIEMTLTNRENMGFRMLLGRNAIIHHYYVDPSQAFILTPPESDARQLDEEEEQEEQKEQEQEKEEQKGQASQPHPHDYCGVMFEFPTTPR